ncbi:MAG: acyl-CoA thioesterase [Firmicutes bacterium]|nr:acyl-CoA thioesterase [Bacillota bacterium]
MAYIHEQRIQFFDTDKMQVTHHANYIRFFETARTEYLRSEGLPYSDMEKGDFQIPVLGVEAKFKTPSVYDELIAIECRIGKIAPASFEVEYEIRNAETGKVHVTGRSRHGFTDANLRPIPLKKKNPELYNFFMRLSEQDKK